MVDIYPFGVEFTWEKDGQPHTQLLFERNSTVPSAKLLTLFRCAAVPTSHMQLRLVQGAVALFWQPAAASSCVFVDCTAPTPGCSRLHGLQAATVFTALQSMVAAAAPAGTCQGHTVKRNHR